MCAYKLCKVEFRYWGMQSKIERFIHDVALRKTMLKAHSQAWTWQDEWFGLTMEDIRAIEKETAEMLRKTMGGGLSGEEGGDEGEYRAGFDLESSAQVEVDVSGNNTTKAQFSSIEYSEADEVFAAEISKTLPMGVYIEGRAAEVKPFETGQRGNGSTDVGDVSWTVPTVGMSTATWVPGTGAHTWQAGAAGGIGRALAFAQVEAYKHCTGFRVHNLSHGTI